MKTRFSMIAAAAIAAGCATALFAEGADADDAAELPKALLIVQNHSTEKDPAVLTAMGDLFASALDETDLFEIVNPNDVIGEGQNIGPWGEKMPVSSATRLAESCGADILLTAAITDFSRRNVGTPAVASSYQVTWSVAAKRVPGGATICSVSAPFVGKPKTARMFEANVANFRDEALRGSVKAASGVFLAKAAKKRFGVAKSAKVGVSFVANVAGADVKIDGVSVGIASTDLAKPLTVEVSKGLHNLEISYPFMLPYKTVARFDGASTFAVNLHESQEGRALRQGDVEFDTRIGRIVKSGATDDDVKLIKAKGYAKYLEASSIKIEGMPERLTMVDKPGVFGLGIIQEDK